jgi:hypothetical protein
MHDFAQNVLIKLCGLKKDFARYHIKRFYRIETPKKGDREG